ncbi:fumarylacetoacetate hydrolase family protein [Castellaniella sp. WN]
MQTASAPNYPFPGVFTNTLPIAGSEQRFPVRRVYCVGKNYMEHIKEMNGDVSRPPFFFQKPADAIMQNGSEVPYPPATAEFHYEGELVVAIGKSGRKIAPGNALTHVFGYAAGLDLTRRDLQNDCMDKGLPWEPGKSFDHSAPIGTIQRSNGGAPEGRIVVKVNGQERQNATLADMIWDVPRIIAELSGLYELQPGDLIYTGTPKGVGATRVGDTLEVRIDTLPPLSVKIASMLA